LYPATYNHGTFPEKKTFPLPENKIFSRNYTVYVIACFTTSEKNVRIFGTIAKMRRLKNSSIYTSVFVGR